MNFSISIIIHLLTFVLSAIASFYVLSLAMFPQPPAHYYVKNTCISHVTVVILENWHTSLFGILFATADTV